MSDILLTHGYFLQEDPLERVIMKPYPPLGILYISSYLKAKGFGVSVFDSTFASMDDFRNRIVSERPSTVGIYSNLMTKLNVLRQIAFCNSQGCRVIVGGPDVAAYGTEYVEYGASIAVIGEGELTVEELLRCDLDESALRTIPGIVYRDSSGAIVTTPQRSLIPDLDLMPFPDRDAIDIGRYISAWRERHGMGSVSLICARGCPFTCTWCSRSVFGESHRRRSVGNVLAEIEYIRERYAPDMLWFADDVFTINHKWLSELHAEMRRRGIRIPFECISRADRLNDDILAKMAEMGAFRIWYGSESGSQRILDAMKRRVTVGEIQAITQSARHHGIQSGLFVMLGYPGEELSDIDETARHLKAAGADIVLTTLAYPIKGTDMYNSLADSISSPGPWNHVTDRNLRYPRTYSDTFYAFANRYLINDVRHHRLMQTPESPLRERASAFLKAKASRVAMNLLQHF